MSERSGDSAERPDDDLAWETLGGDVVYECPGFDVRREAVRLPDGTETEFDYLSEPPAVVILPLTPDGSVVVIEEWRQAVGRVNRGLPAGTVESDDADLAAAARRELREETGYDAGSVEALTSVEPSNGVAGSVHHYFLARDCEPTAEQELDFNESIRVETTSRAALRESIRDGDIRDGRAALAVLYFELFG
jgi:ADP-ribose pyrophosphatase